MQPRLVQEVLFEPKRSFRKAAATQLQDSDPDEVARDLLAALRRAPKSPLPASDAVLDLVTKWAAPIGIPVLIELWARAGRNDDAALEKKVARYLGRAGVRDAAAEVLAAALERPDPTVRSAALRLWTLARPVGASARLGVLRGLQDYDYTCRFEALRLACQHRQAELGVAYLARDSCGRSPSMDSVGGAKTSTRRGSHSNRCVNSEGRAECSCCSSSGDSQTPA